MNDKYIIYFISKTKKKMSEFIERKLKEKNLNDLVPSYGNILTVLYDNGGRLNMKEIGALLGKDKSTITALINKLIKLDYVMKEKSKTDKRVTYIVLTKKAREIEDKFNKISKSVNQTAYKDFTDEEKEIFLRLLKKLNTNFSE
ncbi:MarR family transcriptional regulator [Peptostreptococcaceae bacterium AGR-M142]